MAQIDLTATISASSDTVSNAGIRFALGSIIKGPTPQELRGPVTLPIPLRLPNGEEVVVLRSVRRA